MSAVRTGVYVDTSAISFVTTETTPRTFAIPQCTDIQPDQKGTPIFFSGDNAPGPTAKKVTNQMREVKIMNADLGNNAKIPFGVDGTLTWVENDMKNGVTVGALSYTLARCSLDENAWGGEKNTAKKGNMSFSAVWALISSVYTDPLTFAEA